MFSFSGHPPTDGPPPFTEMASLEFFYTEHKLKKRIRSADLIGSTLYNHPHPLSEVEVTGTMNFTDDSRERADDESRFAYLETLEVDFSLLEKYSRVYEERTPFFNATPSGNPGPNKFFLFHQPERPWRIIDRFGFPVSFDDDDGFTKIGTLTSKNYTRDSEDDPWELGDEETIDIDGSFFFTIFGGGDPNSGGKVGEPEDPSDPAQAEYGTSEIELRIEMPASPITPYFLFIAKRFPWDNSWSDESAGFSQIFNAALEELQETGDGYSGSCSLKVIFTS